MIDELYERMVDSIAGGTISAPEPGHFAELARDDAENIVDALIEEFNRMIEAVRAEEREKAAQIAESLYFGGGATGSANRWGAKQAAARIRARGEEQGREPEKSPPRYGILRCGDYMGGSRDEIILTTEEDARSVEYTGWSYGVRVWMEKVSGMKEQTND